MYGINPLIYKTKIALNRVNDEIGYKYMYREDECKVSLSVKKSIFSFLFWIY
jgi:hypothetical protein